MCRQRSCIKAQVEEMRRRRLKAGIDFNNPSFQPLKGGISLTPQSSETWNEGMEGWTEWRRSAHTTPFPKCQHFSHNLCWQGPILMSPGSGLTFTPDANNLLTHSGSDFKGVKSKVYFLKEHYVSHFVMKNRIMGGTNFFLLMRLLLNLSFACRAAGLTLQAKM